MFVALGIQHVMHMRHIILSSVACVALPYFYKLSLKRRDFRKKKTLLNTKYVFWLSLKLSSETSLILRTNKRDMIKNVY